MDMVSLEKSELPSESSRGSRKRMADKFCSMTMSSSQRSSSHWNRTSSKWLRLKVEMPSSEPAGCEYRRSLSTDSGRSPRSCCTTWNAGEEGEEEQEEEGGGRKHRESGHKEEEEKGKKVKTKKTKKHRNETPT